MFLLAYKPNLKGLPRDLAFRGEQKAHTNYVILKRWHESEAVVLMTCLLRTGFDEFRYKITKLHTQSHFYVCVDKNAFALNT